MPNMIEAMILRCRNPAAQIAFYCDVLGMQRVGNNSVSYGDGATKLSFQACETGADYQHRRNNLYWKIALTLPDVDYAIAELSKKGIAVSDAHQFRDIGYLARFSDPEGFQIELLQHRFESNQIKGLAGPSAPLGGARFGLITLRTSDINDATKLCCDALGMRTLCVEPVEPFGFTLYFFAYTDENPPNADLNAVENREWLYQRPYTTLEVQHLHDADSLDVTPENAPGYGGLVLRANPSGSISEILGNITIRA